MILTLQGSAQDKNKKKEDVITVKEEIFSDDDASAGRTGKQKRKRKTESASGLDSKTVSPNKARKTDLETDKADDIDISTDKGTAGKKKKVTAKRGKQKSV